MLKILQKFVEKTCCMLLVEHRGGQGEEVVVVDGREGGVHVDDIVWWSITPLVHPSTWSFGQHLILFHQSLYLGE